MAVTTIDSSAVVAAFGAFYIDAGQGENNIFQRLMEQFGTMSAFRQVATEDTVLRESNVAFTEVLQSFQKAFTAKGGVNFTPKAISLFNMKFDELFYPDDLKNSWLSFVTSNNLDRTTWPFVRWFIEMYVLKQVNKDLEMAAIFGGVYVAPTAGVAGTAAQTMDGIKKLIATAVAAGTTTVIATGTPSLDPVTWCNQVEVFMAGIPEVYWVEKMTLNMSRTLALRYTKGRRLKYNSTWSQVSVLNTVEDFENITITPRDSSRGSLMIWMTPIMNAVMAMKGGSNKDVCQVEKVDRQVKVFSDFWIGIGFIDDGLIFVNDQQ